MSSKTLETKWINILEKFKNSDLNISQFCRKEGMTAASFYYWRDKLKLNLDKSNLTKNTNSELKISNENFISINEKQKNSITFKIMDCEISLSALPDAKWIADFVKEVNYDSSVKTL